MGDILFKTEDMVYSHRVAGICVKNGCVLLQKPDNDSVFAFPGGHVALGETHEEALKREFAEEMSARIRVGEPAWIGELFFSWGERMCHQICLYYRVQAEGIPESGRFEGKEKMPGGDSRMMFYWMPLEKLAEAEVYPLQAAEYLSEQNGGVRHFVYRENVKK